MTIPTRACTLDPVTLGIQTFDGVLPDPVAYRAYALACTFQTIQTDDELWHGIALEVDRTLPDLVAALVPDAQTRFTCLRKSPHGQVEPNFIHSDEGMGAWTAVLYLNPEPAQGDGTAFWRHRPTGMVRGSARGFDKTPADWERWQHVQARFNRLLVFDSLLFHSRALKDNYGDEEHARLIQVAFGTFAA